MNLHGTFHMVHATLPVMRAQQDGLVINITSIAGLYLCDICVMCVLLLMCTTGQAQGCRTPICADRGCQAE